jgi:hypothetical protein
MIACAHVGTRLLFDAPDTFRCACGARIRFAAGKPVEVVPPRTLPRHPDSPLADARDEVERERMRDRARDDIGGADIYAP